VNRVNWRTRALSIPDDAYGRMNPAHVKVNLPAPTKWKASHVHTRDPVHFLREVHNYATCSRQALAVTLGNSLDEPPQRLYELAIGKSNRNAHNVSWAEAVDLFCALIGTDLFDAEYDATMKLTRGEFKQGKSQSVLEYATQFRSAVMAASHNLPGTVICDKFVSGLHHTVVKRECMYPINGGKWEDLQACITFAIACEKRIVSSMGNATVNAANTPKPSVPANAPAPDSVIEDSVNVMRFGGRPKRGKKPHKHSAPHRSQEDSMGRSSKRVRFDLVPLVNTFQTALASTLDDPATVAGGDACKRNPPSSVPMVEHTLGAAKHTEGLTFLFKGNFAGHRCSVLFDTGASTCFVDGKWLDKTKENRPDLAVSNLSPPVSIRVANDEQVIITQECQGTMLLQRKGDKAQVIFPRRTKQRGVRLDVGLKILPNMLKGIDIIIGMDYMREIGVVLDCKKETLIINTPSEEKAKTTKQNKREFYGLLNATYKLQEAAKSGYLSAKQAAKELKAGATSWLLLVQHDEEISDTLAAAGVCNETPEETPGLMSQSKVNKITEEFQDVFQPVTDCQPHRFNTDHTIKLVDGATPPFKRPYRLTKEEEKEVHKQIEDALSKGLIEPSVSPYGAPVLFVQKKDGCRALMTCWTNCMAAPSSHHSICKADIIRFASMTRTSQKPR